ncbi:hypothetical protein AB0L40_23415 [Patulibacter sp. NPDC049589]|uniref:hypothetical protein n=1 Tax=Patulibacter sp. NPDC049589 TaxID=3154731 RepID=UPI003444CA0F
MSTSKGARRVTCTVRGTTKKAGAALTRSRATLIRSGRTYARGTTGGLAIRRSTPHGRYTLRVVVGHTAVRYPVAVR